MNLHNMTIVSAHNQPTRCHSGIDGVQLLFLNESQLEETFGARFRHGVEVTLVTAEELRSARAAEEDGHHEAFTKHIR